MNLIPAVFKNAIYLFNFIIKLFITSFKELRTLIRLLNPKKNIVKIIFKKVLLVLYSPLIKLKEFKRA